MQSKNKESISVIIPTYNRANYIEQSLDSIFQQSISLNLEIIVVDDGSTDNTENILKKYENKIIYKRISHSGNPAKARNFGIAHASGSLIAFLDSDDMWTQNKLADQLVIFEDPSAQLVYGKAVVLDDNIPLVSYKDLKLGEKFSSLLKTNAIPNSTVIVRKDALKKVNYIDESDKLRAIEDYHLWLKIASKYPSGIRFCNKVVAHYRKHEGNISNVSSVEAAKRVLAAHMSIWSFLTPKKREEVNIDDQIISDHKRILFLQRNSFQPPLISIVMSVYNGEKYIKSSVDSILNQTFHDFEFIIINDGSTDKTGEILAAYDDYRLHVIKQENQGLVKSLNTACLIASGQYIARQDADDISLPSRLEKELQLMTSDRNIGIVGTFFTYINEGVGDIDSHVTITGPTKNLDIKRAMYFNNPFGHGTVLFKKSLLDSVGLYTEKYGPTEDYELWKRFIRYCDFGIVPETLYLYRINPQGISQTQNTQQQKYTQKIKKGLRSEPFIHKSIKQSLLDGKYYQKCGSHFSEQIYSQYVSQQIEVGKMLLHRGDIKTGLKTAYSAIRMKPKSVIYFINPSMHGMKQRIRRVINK